MSIIIIATYRSLQSNVNVFLSELDTVLTSDNTHTHCVWIEDINIAILEINTSIATERLFNLL